MARGDDPLHVWQLSDGRWRGQVTDGYLPSGGPRRRYVHGRTETEARTAKKALLRTIAEGQAVSTRKTVRSWAVEWLDIQDRRLRPTTASDYRSKIMTWVVPAIGKRRLSDLTPADVRAVTTALRSDGRSSTTQAHVQTVMTKMFRDAIQEGHTVPARVLSVDRPAHAVNDQGAIPLDDAIALLRVAAGDSDGSRWAAGLLQGMRQAERLGLTWDQVDLDTGTLTISWQLKPVPYVSGRAGSLRVPDGYEYRQLDGNLCLVRPKSRKGWRVIPLVPWMAGALMRHRDETGGAGLVWPRPGGRPETARGDAEAWYALQDRAQVARVDGALGRRYHGHEMRHTTATLLMALGVPDTVRTAILGHSSIAVSHRYEHADLTQARAALEMAAGRLGLTAG